MSPSGACANCGKQGELEVELYYCEKCKLYNCVDCLKMVDSDGAYSGHSKKRLYCPKKRHFMGHDWF